MKKTKNSVWNWSTYRRENPIRIVKLFFRDVKYSIQRIKYGWCESDTWGIDYWFLNVVPDMLLYLKNNKHGYPISFDENGEQILNSEEEWDKVLDEIIYLFHESSEDYCSIKNRYNSELANGFADENKKHLWIQEEKNLGNYREQCKNQAFELFSKYFYDLWD